VFTLLQRGPGFCSCQPGQPHEEGARSRRNGGFCSGTKCHLAIGLKDVPSSASQSPLHFLCDSSLIPTPVNYDGVQAGIRVINSGPGPNARHALLPWSSASPSVKWSQFALLVSGNMREATILRQTFSEELWGAHQWGQGPPGTPHGKRGL
jgi:hypothetical protein